MSPARARLTLLALLGCLLSCLATPVPPYVRGSTGEAGDVAMYKAQLSRLRADEPYYRAIGDEMRLRGYATRSVFDWRTPLLFSTLARVPEGAGRAALVALGVLLLSATIATTARQSPWVACGTGIVQAGAAAMVMVPTAAVVAECWAGVLIGLSVCLFGLKRPKWAVPTGLLALFVRELAAPYCVICTAVAVMNRRWREVAAWLAGAGVYAAYYGWHLVQVRAHQLPTDLAHPSSWLTFGGLASVLGNTRWQAWLLLSPDLATRIALTAVLAGVIANEAQVHVRVASLAFVGFFLVAGQEFDGYWGLVAWPTWALACGYGFHLTLLAARAAVRSS